MKNVVCLIEEGTLNDKNVTEFTFHAYLYYQIRSSLLGDTNEERLTEAMVCTQDTFSPASILNSFQFFERIKVWIIVLAIFAR